VPDGPERWRLTIEEVGDGPPLSARLALLARAEPRLTVGPVDDHGRAFLWLTATAVAVRRLLKRLLRRHGLACVRIEEGYEIP
jgi:hypothetical protein